MSSTKPSSVSGVHLLGSFSAGVPSAEAAFRLASEQFGDRLLRVPDGETGARHQFTAFQHEIFNKGPLWKELWCGSAPNGWTDGGKRDFSDDELAQILTEMKRPADQGGLEVLYDKYAIESYKKFRDLREQGVIKKGTRFQVGLASPVNVVCSQVRLQYRAAFEPVYEAAMMRAIDNIQANIPHEDLAIQLDLAIEFAMLERVPGPMWQPWFSSDDLEDQIVARILKLCGSVANDVQLGLHLCYGDLGHRHFVEPKDTEVLVDIASKVLSRRPDGRAITWIHMPVPKDRTDEAYYSPLSKLDLGETKLALGLVHGYDEEGTLERIKQAGKAVGSFLIASECGYGRTPDEEFRSALDILAKYSQSVNV